MRLYVVVGDGGAVEVPCGVLDNGALDLSEIGAMVCLLIWLQRGGDSEHWRLEGDEYRGNLASLKRKGLIRFDDDGDLYVSPVSPVVA